MIIKDKGTVKIRGDELLAAPVGGMENFILSTLQKAGAPIKGTTFMTKDVDNYEWVTSFDHATDSDVISWERK